MAVELSLSMLALYFSAVILLWISKWFVLKQIGKQWFVPSLLFAVNVNQNCTQLLPQQTLLLIPCCRTWLAECQHGSPAGLGLARGTAPMSAPPASRHFLSVSLDLDVQKHTCTWGSLYCPSGMGRLSSPIAKFSLQPGMLGRIPCFSYYKL